MRLDEANEKKAEMDILVADLTEKLAVLEKDFQMAMDEKNDAEAKAAKCANKMDLANRLVNALGSEKDRWANSIIELGEQI